MCNVSEVTWRVVNVVHKMAGAAAGGYHLGGSILAATTGAARAEPALHHHVHQVAFVPVLLSIAATVQKVHCRYSLLRKRIPSSW